MRSTALIFAATLTVAGCKTVTPAATTPAAAAPFAIEETTISQIHAAMRAKTLTCRALVEAYLARIEAFDKKGPALNAITLVNPGRTRTEADVIAAVAHLTAEARRANATFYPIDPVGAPRGPDLTLRMSADDWRRSLETQRSALRTLSQTTGGICICGTNDINPPLRRVASETANYYLVSFRPDGQNPDRPRHRVRIATTRSGVILRYAADYFSAPR